MSRDWDAEQADINREYTEAIRAMDQARIKAAAATGVTSAEDFAALHEATERFAQIKDRRSAFFQDRVAHEHDP